MYEKSDTVALKAIAILFVLLGHMNLLDSSGAWGVHIFLLLSGYGLEISYQRNGLRDYWKKRFKKVFVPYEAVILIALIVELIINTRCNVLSVLVSIVGFDFGYNIDPSMWYISYCFLLYAEFYIWKKVTNKVMKYILPVLFILFNLLLSIIDKIGFITIWSSAAQVWIYTIDFYIGIMLVNRKRPNEIIQNIIIFCVAVYFVMRYGQLHYKADMVLFSFSAAILTIFLNFKLRLGEYKVMQKLGNISFYVYLVEGHFLRWKGYLLDSNYNKSMNALVFMMCLFGGYIVFQVSNIIQNKFLSCEHKKRWRGRT